MNAPISEPLALLQAVREVVAADTGRHEQRDWVFTGSYSDRQSLSDVLVSELRQFALQPVPAEPANLARPICQTQGCVAGWAVILGAPDEARITRDWVKLSTTLQFDIEDYAAELLGLEDYQTNWLFSSDRDREEVLWGLGYLIEHFPCEDDLEVVYSLKDSE